LRADGSDAESSATEDADADAEADASEDEDVVAAAEAAAAAAAAAADAQELAEGSATGTAAGAAAAKSSVDEGPAKPVSALVSANAPALAAPAPAAVVALARALAATADAAVRRLQAGADAGAAAVETAAIAAAQRAAAECGNAKQLLASEASDCARLLGIASAAAAAVRAHASTAVASVAAAAIAAAASGSAAAAAAARGGTLSLRSFIATARVLAAAAADAVDTVAAAADRTVARADATERGFKYLKLRDHAVTTAASDSAPATYAGPHMAAAARVRTTLAALGGAVVPAAARTAADSVAKLASARANAVAAAGYARALRRAARRAAGVRTAGPATAAGAVTAGSDDEAEAKATAAAARAATAAADAAAAGESAELQWWLLNTRLADGYSAAAAACLTATLALTQPHAGGVVASLAAADRAAAAAVDAATGGDGMLLAGVRQKLAQFALTSALTAAAPMLSGAGLASGALASLRAERSRATAAAAAAGPVLALIDERTCLHSAAAAAGAVAATSPFTLAAAFIDAHEQQQQQQQGQLALAWTPQHPTVTGASVTHSRPHLHTQSQLHPPTRARDQNWHRPPPLPLHSGPPSPSHGASAGAGGYADTPGTARTAASRLHSTSASASASAAAGGGGASARGLWALPSPAVSYTVLGAASITAAAGAAAAAASPAPVAAAAALVAAENAAAAAAESAEAARLAAETVRELTALTRAAAAAHTAVLRAQTRAVLASAGAAAAAVLSVDSARTRETDLSVSVPPPTLPAPAGATAGAGDSAPPRSWGVLPALVPAHPALQQHQSGSSITDAARSSAAAQVLATAPVTVSAVSSALVAAIGYGHWSVHVQAAAPDSAESGAKAAAASAGGVVFALPAPAAAATLTVTSAPGPTGAGKEQQQLQQQRRRQWREFSLPLTTAAAWLLPGGVSPVFTDCDAYGGLRTLTALGRAHPLVLGRAAAARARARAGTAAGAGSGSLPLPTTNAKSENQLHALVFARGEVVQAVDMNQDLGWEAALLLRRMTTEFKWMRPRFAPALAATGGVVAVADASGRARVAAAVVSLNAGAGWQCSVLGQLFPTRRAAPAAVGAVPAVGGLPASSSSLVVDTAPTPTPQVQPWRLSARLPSAPSNASNGIEMQPRAPAPGRVASAASASALPPALSWPWVVYTSPQDESEQPKYLLVGCPERIYTGGTTHVAALMAAQESAFATIVQRVLRYSAARLHYGHPDQFDAYWLRGQVGLSKASPEINLSEDVFWAYDALQRLPAGVGASARYTHPPTRAAAATARPEIVPVPRAHSAFVEYLAVGKGRDVGLLSTAVFQNKIARGAGTMLRGPDLHRLSGFAAAGAHGGGSGGGGAVVVTVLAGAARAVGAGVSAAARAVSASAPTGHSSSSRQQGPEKPGAGGGASTDGGLDTVSALSVQLGSAAHYAYTLLFDHAISSYVWVLLALAAARIDSQTVGLLGSVYAIPWLLHLGYAFGLPLLSQMVLSRGLLRGLGAFAVNFITGLPYYIFLMRTKADAFAAATAGTGSGALGNPASAPLPYAANAGASTVAPRSAPGSMPAAAVVPAVGVVSAGAYVGTGRTLPLAPHSLLELYSVYAHSHILPAWSLVTALVAYATVLLNYQTAAGESAAATDGSDVAAGAGGVGGHSWAAVAMQTHAVAIALLSWLLAPALYNPLVVTPLLAAEDAQSGAPTSTGTGEPQQQQQQGPQTTRTPARVSLRAAARAAAAQVSTVALWARRGFEPLSDFDSDTDTDTVVVTGDGAPARGTALAPPRSLFEKVFCVSRARLRRLSYLHASEVAARRPGAAWATWWWRARADDLTLRATRTALTAGRLRDRGSGAAGGGRACAGFGGVLASVALALVCAAPWLLLSLLLLSSLAQAAASADAGTSGSVAFLLLQTAAAAAVAAAVGSAAVRAHSQATRSRASRADERVRGRRSAGSAAALAVATLLLLAAALAAGAAASGAAVASGAGAGSRTVWGTLAAIRAGIWASLVVVAAVVIAAVAIAAACLRVQAALVVRRVARAAVTAASAATPETADAGPATVAARVGAEASAIVAGAAPWGAVSCPGAVAGAAAVVLASPWGAPYRWVIGRAVPTVTATAHAAVTVGKVAALRLVGGSV
jgi:hypothetical protein